MANPAAIRQRMHAGDFLQEAVAAGRARLLINCAILLISAAGSAIIHTTVSNTSAVVVGGPAHPFTAFLVFLLGVLLAKVALVADQFPGAARVGGEAVARELRRHYMFRGGN
ncbi:hypothetical protein ACP70R_044020 [Stipagrostis hirtigluma subsp. patula]